MYGHRFGPSSPRAYDEYLKAYSVAMLPGRERENLSYGGKSARRSFVFRGGVTDSQAQSSCLRQLWLI